MRTVLLCTACLLTGFTTVAVAVPPGWTWGAGNCGFPNTISPRGCELCCRQGLFNGHINNNELQGCYDFCNNHTFPPRPRLRRAVEWVVRLIR